MHMHVNERWSSARGTVNASTVSRRLEAFEAALGARLIDRTPCDAHTAKVCGLVEIPLAPALRASLPPLQGGALWLVAHRALREVPRIAAVWDFLEEEARRAGLVHDPAPGR